MATTSTVETVIAKLVELLTAALVDVPVMDAPPMDAPQRVVFIGNVHSWRSDYVVIRAGRKPRQESYRVNVHMRQTIDQSATATVARAQGVADRAKLEDIIANDPSLGLSATLPTLVADIPESAVGVTPPPDGWRVECIAQVGVSVRLS